VYCIYKYYAWREGGSEDDSDWGAGANRSLFMSCVSGGRVLRMLQDLLRSLPAPLRSHQPGCPATVVMVIVNLLQVPNMPTSSAVTVNGTWSNTSSTFLSMRCASFAPSAVEDSSLLSAHYKLLPSPVARGACCC
jgi:hypothetical protein